MACTLRGARTDEARTSSLSLIVLGGAPLALAVVTACSTTTIVDVPFDGGADTAAASPTPAPRAPPASRPTAAPPRGGPLSSARDRSSSTRPAAARSPTPTPRRAAAARVSLIIPSDCSIHAGSSAWAASTSTAQRRHAAPSANRSSPASRPRAPRKSSSSASAALSEVRARLRAARHMRLIRPGRLEVGGNKVGTATVTAASPSDE